MPAIPGTIETHVGDKGLGYLPDSLTRYDSPVVLTLAPSRLPDESPDLPISSRTSDQGPIGSCTGQAVIGAKEDQDLRHGTDVDWSRRFGYLLGLLALRKLTLEDYRRSPQTVRPQLSDTGALIRHVVDGVNRYGCPSEAVWPYDVSAFNALPDDVAIEQASRNRLLTKSYCDSAEQARVALHEGYSVVLGFMVYKSFSQVGSDGLYRIPSGAVQGGHAVQAVKHSASFVVPGFGPGAFLMRNSWGMAWGAPHPTMASKIPGRGFFWLPDEIVDSRDVDDIWAIKQE